jgi:uncharacterized protein (DUF2252 family)
MRRPAAKRHPKDFEIVVTAEQAAGCPCLLRERLTELIARMPEADSSALRTLPD